MFSGFTLNVETSVVTFSDLGVTKLPIPQLLRMITAIPQMLRFLIATNLISNYL
jgi:hypothetical protein